MELEWIKPEERMPEAGKRVLIQRKAIFHEAYYVDIGYWSKKDWRTDDGRNLKVRAWAELPKIDNEGGNIDEKHTEPDHS